MEAQGGDRLPRGGVRGPRGVRGGGVKGEGEGAKGESGVQRGVKGWGQGSKAGSGGGSGVSVPPQAVLTALSLSAVASNDVIPGESPMGDGGGELGGMHWGSLWG